MWADNDNDAIKHRGRTKENTENDSEHITEERKTGMNGAGERFGEGTLEKKKGVKKKE